MITRTQKIDFIYNNFTRKGKKLTKKELNSYNDMQIDYIINKYSNEKEVMDWINRPKLIKYYVEGNSNGSSFTIEVKAIDEVDLRKTLKAEKINIEKFVIAKGHHICKYCNGIANGSTKDLLCEDCRKTFGHSFYSEL